MRLRGGIRRQLQWLGVIPALIMLALLLVSLTWQRFQDADNEVHQRGAFLAQQLASSSEYGVLSGNVADLRRQARLALERPDVKYVLFRDQNGGLLLRAGASPGSEPDRVLEFHAGIYRQPAMREPGMLALPALSNPDRVGEVVVGLSRARLLARQKEILGASLLPAVLALLIGLIISRWLARQIATPLSYLSGLVRVIRGGGYHVRGALELRGELGDLQNDINELAASLEQVSAGQQRAIDDLREAHQRAESASQAKSDFLAMMSHELRTPMNGVLGMLQLMETTEQNAEQREYTQAALESTGHLLEVINDILDFSRIEAGRMEIDQAYFEPITLLENCVATFRYLALEKGLYLRLKGTETLDRLELCCDATRLRQILSNLISNAVKFTETGGVTVAVSARLDAQQMVDLTVDVTDTGIGIADHKLDKLFKAFSQIEASTSRRFGGTGLGLVIARRLAQMLGGDLTVSSTPGQGSRFTLKLRLRSRPARQTVRPDANLPVVGLRGHVLLVEDNEVNRMVARRMLEHLGLTVTTAGDGQSALWLSDQRAFDCILMDVQMPVMDGLEATRQIRRREADKKLRAVPIIALTANAMSDERRRCLDAGMDAHLAKPFRRHTLGKLLSRFLPAA